jgi:hypothetical protein
MNGWNNIRVNGTPAGTFRILFEGQESSSGLDTRVSDELQPSVDAIQEFTLQTSNFSAEFGLVAGGLFNFTSRSGTNQFHGSGYDYFVNEDLNAAYPFSNDGSGKKVRPRNRRNDYGGTALGSCQWGSLNFCNRHGDYPACAEALLEGGAKIRDPLFGSEDVQAILRRYAARSVE